MSGPFRSVEDGRMRLSLEPVERTVIRTVARLLDEGDDAGGRLDYSAHPDDPAADRRYRELVAGSLDELRVEDRARFETVIAGEAVVADDVEAFMRVVGEARLVIAARLGIEEDGWEQDAVDDPDLAVLGWLGWLQDAAVMALSADL